MTNSARYVKLNVLSGRQFPIYWPLVDDIAIEDIAHGLAGKFRWAGQSRDRYTVAQHSVEVSQRLPASLRLLGLLHDAPEAYLGDIPGPLKQHLLVELSQSDGRRLLRGYSCIEAIIMAVIGKRYGLPSIVEMPEAVHVADRRERARERRDLFGHAWPPEDDQYPAYPEPLAPVGVEEAEAMFLARFRELYQGE